jgi:2-C-methyl-D-erythritol 4-phosphate cytidylyltransferase
MGKGTNKVFLPLAGQPVLRYSVQALAACPAVDDLVVVVARRKLPRKFLPAPLINPGK